ncbi:phosphomannomutase [Desulfitobacterium dichloroeliminans LMG P-21439]|uniref:Phosphoglucomutase n=1 Tax=Desulfitobacterium dichloroeliminans (strain LMG P-21439 / DCA1) TaxID=871963 RepID=L0F6B2_DESDL|nr:phospho-sugar mutase [Desulfitobacterium dichloroeliminans]AGA69384.1 phosphomannomutase [Desulfitobacterium dichloroeliminans LMG P-21439]
MFQERYQFWLNDPYFDEVTRSEVASLSDLKEIEDRFYTDLEFGTGGLRGILGAGTNRMNIYVIRKATQGLADLILEGGEESKNRGVVIAYDSRCLSDRFAQEAALILAGNGIKAYLFNGLRPTPELSFAVRHLHAQAGIVITASHNPKEYNGYKVYWEDGGQVPPDRADQILHCIKVHEHWNDIHPLPEKEARKRGLLIDLGEEMDSAYLKRVKELALYPDLAQEKGSKLSIVYTPLHGAGNMLVRRILTEMGYSVFTVPEQENPDSEFPTVPYPNPEISSTFDLARKYGKAQDAQLLIATDPDADRLGMVIRTPSGDYQQLTGNQIGILLTYYLITQKRRLGILPKNAVIIKTIASTDLADLMVKDLGVQIENVLTGFKFIAEKEQEMEDLGIGDFQFGFEESYGYLAGHFVRDKDAVIASLLLCEAALYYQETEGRSLLEILEEIYRRYGYFVDDQISMTLHGKEGKEKMKRMMTTLRETTVDSFGGLLIERIDDYELRKGKRIISPQENYLLSLPQSNVIRYSFQGGGFVMARPSGTEPKIKFYFNIRDANPLELQNTLERVKTDLLKLVAD